MKRKIMKRKISLVVLSALCILGSATGFAACGDEQNKPCAEHAWDGGKVTREATCAQTGETTHTCTVCGETKTELIAKSTAHSWNGGEVDQPDITAEGSITYTCTVCGDTYSESVPAHVGHEWDEGSQLKAPTCTETGKIKYECEVCHAIKTENMSATGEHHFDTFVQTVTEPTCAREGIALYRCTGCENTAEKPIAATGKHALEWTFEGNEHWQACSNDGCSYAMEKTPHGEEDWTQTNRREADCANDGRIDYACKCGATKYEIIPSTGEHHYELKETTKEATCGEAGSGVYACTGCSDTQTREIPATGEHTYQPKFNDTQHYTECSVCRDKTAPIDHMLDYVIDKQATVYETGMRHKACSGCDYREADERYEPDHFVSDYKNGVVADNTSGWEFGHTDYNWSAPTEGRLPGNTGNSESFAFTKSTEFNGDAWLVRNGSNDVISEIKGGWLNGNWSTLAYTVGGNVTNGSYTVALGYKYTPAESHANLYTSANVRIAVLTQDGACKYSEFIHLDGHGTNQMREITNLNTGDKIYVFIELAEEKETDGGNVINSSWSNGDFICRIFEKRSAQAEEQ